MTDKEIDMTKRRGLFAFAFILLGFGTIMPAFAQSGDGEERPSQDYVSKAAIGDMFEIQSSKLALRKAGDANVKRFASQMVKDHTASSGKLKSIIKAEELPLVLPTKLDDTHQQMIDSLSAVSGGDFDRMYHEIQLKAHEEALALHQAYAQNGIEPKLKAFAGKTSKVVETHLGMLKAMHSM